MVVMSCYNVIDRIFIGRGVGSDAIAGLTITFPVMNLSAAIGVLIGAGASARMSIMLGAKDERGAHYVLGNSLVLTLVNALVYLSIFAVFLDDILIAFGASEATLPYARDFMVYILPGMLIMNVTFSFNNIMRAAGHPVKAMVSMLIGTGANLILAPIFIFALDLGISGAAMATDIAMAISCFFVMYHFVDKGSSVRFRRGIYALKGKIVWSIIAIGAAPSLINAASSAINAIINTTLLQYGNNAIAAAGIFSTFASLLCMVILGISQGMQPIVGYNYGAGRIDRVISTFWFTVKIGSVVSVVGCLFAMLFPHLIAMAFTVDPRLIDVTANAIVHAMPLFWVVGFQIVATSFFMSLGMAGHSIFLSLARQVVFLIPALLVLPGQLGLNGVWYSFPVGDFCATAVTAGMVMWQLRRMRQAERLSAIV